MLGIPFDIWQNVILGMLEFEGQHNLIKTHPYFSRLHFIILKINNDYIANELLKIPKYKRIKSLQLYNNKSVTDINDLEHLQKLQFFKYGKVSNLNNDGIKSLNLLELYLPAYTLITEFNHMTNLRVLHLYLNKKITNYHLKGLNLIELYMVGCTNITDINHLKNLRVLDATYTNLGDEGIKDLNLVDLVVSENKLITDVLHMTNLKSLTLNSASGITTECYYQLEGLGISLYYLQ